MYNRLTESGGRMEAAGWPWWLFVAAALWALSIVGWRRLGTDRLTDRAFWGGLAVFNTGLILWTIGPWPRESATVWMGLALAFWLSGALMALDSRTIEFRRLGMVLALLGAAGTTIWLGAYEVAGCCSIAVVLLVRSGPLWTASGTDAVANDCLPATSSTGEKLVEPADSFHPANSAEEVGGLDRRDDWLLGTTLAVSLVLGLGVLRSGLLTESVATGPNRWRMVWPQAVHAVPETTPTADERRRLLPVEWWLAGGLIVLAVWQSGRQPPIEATALQTGKWR
jgi:hypothetical protein